MLQGLVQRTTNDWGTEPDRNWFRKTFSPGFALREKIWSLVLQLVDFLRTSSRLVRTSFYKHIISWYLHIFYLLQCYKPLQQLFVYVRQSVTWLVDVVLCDSNTYLAPQQWTTKHRLQPAMPTLLHWKPTTSSHNKGCTGTCRGDRVGKNPKHIIWCVLGC